MLYKAHSKCLFIVPSIAGLKVNHSVSTVFPYDSKCVLIVICENRLNFKADGCTFALADFSIFTCLILLVCLYRVHLL